MKSEVFTYNDITEALIKLVNIHQILVEQKLLSKIEDYSISFKVKDSIAYLKIEIDE